MGGTCSYLIYDPDKFSRDAASKRLVECLRSCDGRILATPSYHGALSGLIKNSLDYAEDLREDHRPYLDGRAVGCIVCAGGWQATGTALVMLRSIIHALRGWPTPLGVTINTTAPPFDQIGECVDVVVRQQLQEVGRQVVGFA